MKHCLGCGKELPLLWFGANGRYHLCDSCRDDPAKREFARRWSKASYNRRVRTRERTARRVNAPATTPYPWRLARMTWYNRAA